MSNATGKHSTHQTNLSTQLNETIQTMVRHMLHHKSDLSQALILYDNSFIEEVCTVAPDLWDHIKILTQSVNERKGRRVATLEDTYASRLKHLHRAYLLSVVLFITNSECNFPFHILLADTVEANEGSTEVIIILNRLGTVASMDTLKHVILSVTQDRISLLVEYLEYI